MTEAEMAELQAAVDSLRDAADRLTAVLERLTQAVLQRPSAPADIPRLVYPPPGGTTAPPVPWHWSGVSITATGGSHVA